MISENAKQAIGQGFVENIISEKQITEDISFVCVDKGKDVKPRTNIGVVKNGKYHQINLNKEMFISLTEGVNKSNLDIALKEGDAIKYSPKDLLEISKELKYLTPVSKEDIKETVINLMHNQILFMMDVRKTLTEDEKKYLQEEDIDSIINMIMHSQRLLNAIIFLKEGLIREPDITHAWNYIQIYEHKNSFKEIMFFSDWNNNDPDSLMEKYNIKDKIIKTEEHGVLRRNDISLREGEEYDMITHVKASLDDWEGIAVIIKKDWELYPIEIVSAAESLKLVEDNLFVKHQVIRKI